MAVTELDRPDRGGEITIRDEILQRPEAVEMVLRLASLQLTARDLIAERVQAECDRRLIDRSGAQAAPLVAPGADEAKLNGPKDQSKLTGENVDRQIERALEAFGQNAFLLLVDDHQVEALDEPVHIAPGSVVTFLRLTPLVGG